jgi:hypothetical protein
MKIRLCTQRPPEQLWRRHGFRAARAYNIAFVQHNPRRRFHRLRPLIIPKLRPTRKTKAYVIDLATLAPLQPEPHNDALLFGKTPPSSQLYDFPLRSGRSANWSVCRL